MHKQKISNLDKYKKFRNYLRNNSTIAERTLWLKLKNKQTGYKFRRQHGIGPYILDFYTSKLKLAIELDGDIHEYVDISKNDRKKEEFLDKNGIYLLRFSNEDIKKDVEGVALEIKLTCDSLDKE
jgi:very-short-patch-repair endonuclease